MKYDYLKKFITPLWSNSRYNNWFYNVKEETITKVEKEVGFEFPQALKEFWLEIGDGCLLSSEKELEKPIDGLEAKNASNTFWGPEELANMMSDDEEREGYHWLAQEFLDGIERPNPIPFFEMSDSSRFLFMFPGDDAVYDYNPWIPSGNEDFVTIFKFEEHLSDFVYKLYHESAIYYSWAKREPE